jgi:hypothetical protein
MLKAEMPIREVRVAELICDALHGTPLPKSIVEAVARPPESWNLLMFFGEYEKEPEELVCPSDITWARFVEGILFQALLMSESGASVIIDMTKLDDHNMIEALAVSYGLMLSVYYYDEKWKTMIESGVHPCGLITIKLSHKMSIRYYGALAVMSSYKDFFKRLMENGSVPALNAYKYFANYETDMIPFGALEVFGLIGPDADPDDVNDVRGSQSLINYPNWYKNSYVLIRFDRVSRVYRAGGQNPSQMMPIYLEGLEDEDFVELSSVVDEIVDIVAGFVDIVLSIEKMLPEGLYEHLIEMLKDQQKLLYVEVL